MLSTHVARAVLRQIGLLFIMGVSLSIVILLPIIHQVPYLNIYSREVIFLLFCIDMGLSFILFRISYKSVYITGAVFIIIMLVLDMSNLEQEAEYVGNFIFLLFFLGLVKEFFRKPTEI